MEVLRTPKEAAELLKTSPKTVHKLCRDNKLGFVLVNGKDRRFTDEHLEEYVRSRTVPVKKPVDKKASPHLPSARKGGETRKTDVSRASLRKEMRQCR
jgi:excisionase family DNA binding protein